MAAVGHHLGLPTRTGCSLRPPVNPDGGVQPPTGGDPGQRLLTSVTCAELFHTDDRLVAFGHLADDRVR